MDTKAIARLIPVILLISTLLNATLAQPIALELFYDDGEVNAWGFGMSAPGLMHFQYVIRFHSPWELSSLLEAKFYIMDTYLAVNTLGYSADLIVMDTNRATVFSREVVFDQGGWFTVDLRPYAIVVPGDFYIGLEITHEIHDPSGGYIGVPIVGEDDIEAGVPTESWYVRFFEPGMLGYDLYGPVWWDGPNSYYNHMIRAVVSLAAAATVNVDPDTLSLKSKGKWITAYIQLPEGYSVADIDASTILLNGIIRPVLDPKYSFVTNSNEYLIDHNNDGILERMVKFDRVSVMALLGVGEATLTITGEVNGILFEGSDTIKVIG